MVSWFCAPSVSGLHALASPEPDGAPNRVRVDVFTVPAKFAAVSRRTERVHPAA